MRKASSPQKSRPKRSIKPNSSMINTQFKSIVIRKKKNYRSSCCTTEAKKICKMKRENEKRRKCVGTGVD